jgi:hypothetical protein
LNRIKTFSSSYLKTVFIISVFSVYLYKIYLVNTKTEPTANAYDSPSYFNFELFPAFRMQLITLPYFLLEEPGRIVTFQTLISAISWLILALAIMYFFNFSPISILSLPALFILASSSVVLEHNYILASESLNNSAVVILVASAIYYFKSKSTKALIFISTAFVFVAGTKSAAAMAILLVAMVFYLIFILINRSLDLKEVTIISATVLFIIFFAATALSSDITKTLTTSGTINNRIWLDEDWRDQILKSGYPSSAREIWETYTQENLGSPPDQAVVDSPEFIRWWDNSGENFLNIFMLRNLDYSFVGPFCLPCLNDNFKFDKTLVAGWGVGTNEIRNYASLQSSELSRTLFWPTKPENSYLAIGVISFLIMTALLIGVFSKSQLSGALSGSYLILLGFVISYSLISWWFGSKPADMTRHQLAGALTLRVLAFISLVYILSMLFQLTKSLFYKERINEK